MTLDKSISEACAGTPEPERAGRNLLKLFEAADREPFSFYLKEIAGLFSVSQYLANYSFLNPGELLSALKEYGKPFERGTFLESAREGLTESADTKDLMARLRRLKRRAMIAVTLRDVTRKADIVSSMDELTGLAEAVLELALEHSLEKNKTRFGELSSPIKMALIGLGKLGGAELNYSSDLDFMAVYDDEEGGQTSGVLSPTGVRRGRVESHEFYSKVVELLCSLLSAGTEEGIAYRVDLRLRPQGGKGELALPLNAYKTYYESWGRTWERMALVRARPVAGDPELAERLIQGLEPFLWGRTLDYAEIEDIRAMKKKIDSTFSKNDIKRGWGGIREVEFFVQTFQILYGWENTALRTNRLLNAIQALRWMNLIPERELVRLWENYLFLRRTEHYLQMRDDLQTHSLPAAEDELDVLGRKMGFHGRKGFLSELRVRRMQIKRMYNSLLGTEGDVHAEALMLLEEDLDDRELSVYLDSRGVAAPDEAVRSIKRLREQAQLFKTQREISLVRKVLPELLEAALKTESPGRALGGLEGFFSSHGLSEAHLAALDGHRDLLRGMVKVFSLSSYLTRVFMSSPLYLNFLIEEGVIRKTLVRQRNDLGRHIKRAGDPSAGIAEYKKFEELRVGMFFLSGIIKMDALGHYLSHFAEAAIEAALTEEDRDGLAVIAMGKLGGREMTFGSDIDILFVAGSPDAVKSAERLIKTLTAYTEKGMPYRIDLRLRPDGSKGILVNDIEGYRDYYLKNARGWEIQALLKARPVAGDPALGRQFMDMAQRAVLKRSPELKKHDVEAMRSKIVKELSKERESIDIKLGPGGIEDIEFFVQWLQLRSRMRWLLVPGTTAAIGRLVKKGTLGERQGTSLLHAYDYLRRLETFLRLNEMEEVVREDKDTVIAARFMGDMTIKEFTDHLKALRSEVSSIIAGQ